MKELKLGLVEISDFFKTSVPISSVVTMGKPCLISLVHLQETTESLLLFRSSWFKAVMT